MAKKIKFNLICDNKPIRTIEDLQNNFSIEDVLAYYKNGLLKRWLDVHEYADELKRVSAINEDKAMDIIKELIRIFQVVCDEKEIEESVYIFNYLEEKKERQDIYDKEDYKVRKIIEDYGVGYQQSVLDILENPNDVARIKASIQKIVMDYEWVFELNHRELFYILKEKSELAIMCLLMNEKSRGYYLPFSTVYQNETYSVRKILNFDNDENIVEREEAEKEIMYSQICDMVKDLDFLKNLGENLKFFSGTTDDYWKDLEPKGKKYMIVSIGNGDYVRSAGVRDGDLGCADILNKFIILDGIDYKSNS